ncbi:MAG TPA: VWA domain-containing protein [Candidatus Limnocylindria bacterium]|nr:VWA domain-containing protein [Candidatus Limnocylindria bacterium]
MPAAALPPADGSADRPSAGLVGGGPYRYARWDGSQRLPGPTADELLGELSEDLLASGDLASALGRLLSRGVHATPDGQSAGLPGLRELAARLAKARQAALERHRLGDVLAEVRRELDEIVATEQRGLERRLAGASAPASAESDQSSLESVAAGLAARRQASLAELPGDVGGRIRALQEYDFLEPEARERFGALLDRLRKQVLDSYFGGLSEALRQVGPEQLRSNREMVRDLNRLLQQRLAGNEPDVAPFLARHGAFFPGARSLDDIVEHLARRMAAMQSLMASLDARQRQELQETMDALLRDDRLRWDLAQLAATLDQLLPDGLGQRYDFGGGQELSLDGALEQLARLQQLDDLAERLSDVRSADELAALDPSELERLLDAASADDLRALQTLTRQLEEAGLAERRNGRLELTPRGARRIGQKVLDDLFGRLGRDVFGGHPLRGAGSGGELGEGSRAYEFGRPFELDLQRTLRNALAREPGLPARLEPSDFEVHETEVVTRAATVLLVDMSRSMLLRGCFLAAKKVAIALDMLIRTRYPRDELHVVGFAYYARAIRPGGLADLAWHGYEYGTNLQHGLLLARRLLSRSHAANREIVIVTDGEPTAHFEGGQVEFSYPPTRRTIQETLREAARCTRAGITINTFMLERSRALTHFVEQLTRLNRGRAFYATPERLGEYVLVDYVDRRRRSG